MRSTVLEAIRKERLIAIVRGIEPALCRRVAEALCAGGVRLLEITYDQSRPDSWEETARAIGGLARAFDGKMLIGAGTVTSPHLVEITREAGGQFIISPHTDPAVIARTRELDMVSIPGAMTPTEIMTAWQLGGDFVKLFPAAQLGIDYLKSVRAPLNHIPILATGGISEKNARAFLDAGAAGLGVGGSLSKTSDILAGEFGRLTEAAEKLLAAIR